MYVSTTLAYGFTRAVSYKYENSKEYYNSNTFRCETKEKLLVDKIGSIVHGSFTAISLWPSMLREDLKQLECAMTGKDMSEYKSR